MFEITCPTFSAAEVFRKFTEIVPEFVQAELLRAEDNHVCILSVSCKCGADKNIQQLATVARIPASFVDEDLLDDDDDDDDDAIMESLFSKSSEPKIEAEPQDHKDSAPPVSHILKIQKARPFVLQFIQLDQLHDGTLSRTLVPPESEFFDAHSNTPGRQLAQARVCCYLPFDPTTKTYALRSRTITPLDEPYSIINLWEGLTFKEVGTAPPIDHLTPPTEAVEPALDIEQWLADAGTSVDEDPSVIAINSGLHKPQALELLPEKPVWGAFTPVTNAHIPLSTPIRKATTAKLAQTPSPSRSKLSKSASSASKVTGSALYNGWADQPAPKTTAFEFPPLREKNEKQGLTSSRPPTGRAAHQPASSLLTTVIPAGRGWAPPRGGPSSRGGVNEGSRGGGRQNTASREAKSVSKRPSRANPTAPRSKPQNSFDLLIDLTDDIDTSLSSETPFAPFPPGFTMTQLDNGLVTETLPLSAALDANTTKDIASGAKGVSEQVIDRLGPDDEDYKPVLRKTMRQRKPSPALSKKKGKPAISKAMESLKELTLNDDFPTRVRDRIAPQILEDDCNADASAPSALVLDSADVDSVGTVKASRTSTKLVNTEKSDQDMTSDMSDGHSELFRKLKAVWRESRIQIIPTSVLEMQVGQILISRVPESLRDKQFDIGELANGLMDSISGPAATFTNLISTSTIDMQHVLTFFGAKDTNCDHETEAMYEIMCTTADRKAICIIVDAAKEDSYHAEESPVIRESSETLAQIYLHFPQRVWDARLTIVDTVYADPEEEPAVSKLLASLYIRINEQSKLPEITGRDGAGLFVESVRLITKSTYQKSEARIRMTVTRVLDLPVLRSTSTNVDHNGVFYAAASGNVEMINDYRIWYEVALGIIDVPEELLDDEAESYLAHSLDELEQETEKIVLKMDAVGLGNTGLGRKVEKKLLDRMKNKEKKAMEESFW